MEVKVVAWRELPKDAWQDILKLTNIGDYLDSLPYKVPENLHYVRIPLNHYWNYKSEIPTMRILEFERVRAVNLDTQVPQTIFRRTR